MLSWVFFLKSGNYHEHVSLISCSQFYKHYYRKLQWQHCLVWLLHTSFITLASFASHFAKTESLKLKFFRLTLFSFPQTVQLLNYTVQYFQRNGSTAIFRNKENLIPHKVTTTHQQSSCANTTGLTFFRNTKLPVHGYQQSSAHLLPTYCPNS